ncbi:protein At-4/1 isoform X2 [Aristolochia californica]|uniref:protein At-4/1 isoform X2 n=1 Tax=Aristolochia californica TaxID=171875 RepID=UPI0035E12A1A
MAATSDEALESLLRNFEQIHQEYRDKMRGIQLLKLSCNTEIQRREALEITCDTLKRENEHLTKMYTESLAKIACQLEQSAKSNILKMELKEAKDEYFLKEDGYKKTLEVLKQGHKTKICELEDQIRTLQEKNENLIQDIATQKNQIDVRYSRLQQVKGDMELKNHSEIQDLRDLLMVEQEENKEQNKKLQEAETELLAYKTEKQEQHKESTSNHHVNMLKQKIMKLRKENELLRRQLQNPNSVDT